MRLDKIVAEKLNCSRARAQELIKSSAVFVNKKVQTKVSFEVKQEEIEIKQSKMYVSRGAYKLLGATAKFNINLKDKVVLDIGASTGGFTQVCCEQGASKVYALDVGRSQLDNALKSNPSVVDIENTDFRDIKKGQFDDVNFITGDLSFISLRHIFPKIVELFGNKIEICMLFKPQFECGVQIAKKFKGVVLDKAVHKSLLHDFYIYLESLGFKVSGIYPSSIRGKEGNIEYLIYLNGSQCFDKNIDKLVDEAFLMKR